MSFILLCDNKIYFSYIIKDGRSALFHTSQRGHMEIVRLLLGNGADVQICDKVKLFRLFSRIISVLHCRMVGVLFVQQVSFVI